MTEAHGTGKYERLLARCRQVPPISTAVAHPCDDASLSAVVEAARARIIQPILCGPVDRIRRVAKTLSIDIEPFETRVVRRPAGDEIAAEGSCQRGVGTRSAVQPGRRIASFQ